MLGESEGETPSFTHLYGTHLPETSIIKTLDTGSPKPQISDSDTTYWENPREKYWGDLKQ